MSKITIDNDMQLKFLYYISEIFFLTLEYVYHVILIGSPKKIFLFLWTNNFHPTPV